MATLTKWQEAIFQDGLVNPDKIHQTLIFLTKTERLSETDMPYFESAMHFSSSAACKKQPLLSNRYAFQHWFLIKKPARGLNKTDTRFSWYIRFFEYK